MRKRKISVALNKDGSRKDGVVVVDGKCSPDPRLAKRTGWELAAAWGASGLAAAANQSYRIQEWKEKHGKATAPIDSSRLNGLATAKQKGFLKSMGAKFDRKTLTKKEASELIARGGREKIPEPAPFVPRVIVRKAIK